MVGLHGVGRQKEDRSEAMKGAGDWVRRGEDVYQVGQGLVHLGLGMGSELNVQLFWAQSQYACAEYPKLEGQHSALFNMYQEYRLIEIHNKADRGGVYPQYIHIFRFTSVASCGLLSLFIGLRLSGFDSIEVQINTDVMDGIFVGLEDRAFVLESLLDDL